MNDQSEYIQRPLRQEADYDLEEHFIDGKQKTWKKVVEWILTICGWALLLSYIIYLVYGSMAIKYDWYLPEFTIYTREMVLEIQKYFYILFIAALIIAVLLIVWKNYNYRRFGRLNRRKFRPPVENSELAEMFEMDEAMIEKMQNDRYILLETNIIPEDLGIGGKESEK